MAAWAPLGCSIVTSGFYDIISAPGTIDPRNRRMTRETVKKLREAPDYMTLDNYLISIVNSSRISFQLMPCTIGLSRYKTQRFLSTTEKSSSHAGIHIVNKINIGSNLLTDNFNHAQYHTATFKSGVTECDCFLYDYPNIDRELLNKVYNLHNVVRGKTLYSLDNFSFAASNLKSDIIRATLSSEGQPVYALTTGEILPTELGSRIFNCSQVKSVRANATSLHGLGELFQLLNSVPVSLYYVNGRHPAILQLVRNKQLIVDENFFFTCKSLSEISKTLFMAGVPLGHSLAIAESCCIRIDNLFRPDNPFQCAIIVSPRTLNAVELHPCHIAKQVIAHAVNNCYYTIDEN